ncbi:hypothetical protein AVEN_4102-1 [Araneus ventricosus]|uniref:Uncharacterized protein n=1 Tax=Araneus ventricosus TaxID=182803 RepID=A0A4Y2IYM3_ARAVE|nr:hypothetical protein AVEN_4102-1 [Araneus ventricosus]
MSGQLSIYLNAGPSWLTWLGRNHVPAQSQFSVAAFTSFSEEMLIIFWNRDWMGAKFGLYGRSAPDFPLELLKQFLSFASSMGIAMQEHTITQHARAFASDGFTMAQ